MNKKIIYIGTSFSIIDAIISYKKFELRTVICEKKRVSIKYKHRVNQYDLNLLTFETKEDFEKLIDKQEEEIALIYQLDLIVPHSLTSKFEMFNFHSGSVKTNRGAHPILRTILNNEEKSEFTLHKINEKIDQGLLISTYKIDVSLSDDAKDIKYKMEKGFEKMFDDLILYFEGNLPLKPIQGGKYFKPINENDYTIDCFNDSITQIENKIRSQRQYKGAILYDKNQKYFVTHLIKKKIISSKSFNIRIIDDVAFIERTEISFALKLKKIDEVD